MGAIRQFYPIVGENVISVHSKWNLASFYAFGEVIHELRVNGELEDSHSSGSIKKAGATYAILEIEGKKTTIRVDVMSRIIGYKYKLDFCKFVPSPFGREVGGEGMGKSRKQAKAF
ncbi:MAG: hypothetical protein JW959_10445 [Pirellulales bacterium]|nr:hypothetical protein [Pirellulales bacterium]